MLVMIFVNDLSGVKGLPWWNYHMPRDVNGMTYVDMVFPAFLFILGMAVPLATAQRLKKNPSLWRLWLHIVLRTLGLVTLGLILANADKADSKQMGIKGETWALLALLGAVLFWNVYGHSQRLRTPFRILKYGGLALLVWALLVFRRITPDGRAAWFDSSYWEILGLIGWTYLAISLLYIPTRRWRWAPLGWFILLVAMNAMTVARWIVFPDQLPFYIWPFGSGAFGLIAMAGIVTATIFFGEDRLSSFRDKAIAAILFAFLLLAAGWFLTPLGISKIRATPTWCLYSAGSSVLLFTVLYWICDVRKRTAWAAFARPAGANTLLTYLLPDLYYFAFGSIFFSAEFHAGWPGVIKSAVFTGFILMLAAVLTRCKVRMQL